jgi:hypothetical protein
VAEKSKSTEFFSPPNEPDDPSQIATSPFPNGAWLSPQPAPQ